MKKKEWNNIITNLIILFVSVGIGTFVCDVLERTATNIWLARGIGALITAVAFVFCSHIILRQREK